MHARGGKFGIFFVIVIVCVLLILLSQFSFFMPIRGGLEKGLISLVQLIGGVNQSSEDSTLEKLKAENQKLTTQLAKEYLLIEENQAFRDQFAAVDSQAKSILEAKVLSHRDRDSLLLNRGLNDGVKKGQAVIVNDNLVGVVESATPHTAKIKLAIAKDFSVASQTIKTNALGVSRGQDEEGIILQNVLLSDKLEISDFVITKGDKDEKGLGIPPDLLVGKIISIDKKASALYQTAKVESLIDFSRLRTVFILLS